MLSDVDHIIKTLESISPASFADDDQRGRVLAAVRRLNVRVERPIDHMYRLTWMEPAYISSLKILTDVDLFTKWKADGGKPKDVKALSSLSGIEVSLLSRLLRHVGAMNGLQEVTDNTYSMTSFTESLAGSGNRESLELMYDATYPAFLNLPSFLAETGYKNPVSATTGNWQDLKKTPQTYFEYVGSSSARTQVFQSVMTAYNQGKGLWIDFYPTYDLFTRTRPGEVPVFVDVGGGKGFDLQALRRRHPELTKNNLILQDLQEVIDQVPNSDGIMAMSHDILRPQPVRGARTYFMHIVLHGFPNDTVLEILKHTAAAMTPGYSKLLLHEKIITNSFPTPDVTSLDLTMMVTHSAGERSESVWRELLGEAGLKITKIYTTPALFEAIIEVELV